MFLSSITAGRTSSPGDLDRVLRSVRGTDEFRISDGETVVTALTEVSRYQLPYLFSLKTDPTMQGLPNAHDAADCIVGLALKALGANISEFVPIPERLNYLSEAACDVPVSGFVEWFKANMPPSDKSTAPAANVADPAS
jgi:hypothetical protein